MTHVVYENEPFEASPVDIGFLQRLLGGGLEIRDPYVRILHRAGHVRFPDGRTLRIRSRKASGAGLLAWLAYGDSSLTSLRVLGALPDQASENDFGSLVARLFCVETWRAIQFSGLMRSYQRRKVQTAIVRGRIDFSAMARTGGDLSRTPCIVFARLPQTPLNCLLSAAVSAVARDPELRSAAGPMLSPLAALLAEVPARIDRDLLSGKRVLSRIEQPFEASAALARIIIRSAGMAEGAGLASPSFLVDLARLFEDTVARAFHDSSFESVAKRPVQIFRTSDTQPSLARHSSMKLDLYLPDVQGEAVIVDAKYKTQISAANLQQMATYCWLTGARRAVLVVPHGVMNDRRSFVLPAGGGDAAALRIDVAELDLSGRSLADWKRPARALVETVGVHVQDSAA